MEEINREDEIPRSSRRAAGMESINLRDLLKVRDDEADPYSNQYPNEPTTLATVLACDKQALPSEAAGPGSRTLLDVIRIDEDAGHVAVHATTGRRPVPHSHRIGWKAFKSLLQLRRTAVSRNSPSSSIITTIRHVEAPAVEATPPDGDSPGWGVGIRERIESDRAQLPSERQEEEPVRVSLMALLEEADRGTGPAEPSLASALVGAVEEDEETEGAVGAATKGGVYVCCVCMVRHKGAAFIPCGHTFCRLCSRELWVSRGNCPLCNGFILEILDIF